MFGIITIATGDKAKAENDKCRMSFDKHLPDIPFLVIDSDPAITYNLEMKNSNSQFSRYLKTQLPRLVPDEWDSFLYVDSDTRLLSFDIMVMKDHLENGFDMVITPSQSQSFWHITEDENQYTLEGLDYYPLQFQCGVFACKKNNAVKQLFNAWWFEWLKFSDQDQAAFLRALHTTPVKLWLMGYPFNSGNGPVLKHLFGNTR